MDGITILNCLGIFFFIHILVLLLCKADLSLVQGKNIKFLMLLLVFSSEGPCSTQS